MRLLVTFLKLYYNPIPRGRNRPIHDDRVPSLRFFLDPFRSPKPANIVKAASSRDRFFNLPRLASIRSSQRQSDAALSQQIPKTADRAFYFGKNLDCKLVTPFGSFSKRVSVVPGIPRPSLEVLIC